MPSSAPVPVADVTAALADLVGIAGGYIATAAPIGLGVLVAFAGLGFLFRAVRRGTKG